MTNPSTHSRTNTAKTSSLSASGLQKAYKGRSVVKGVSFKVDSGQVVGLLGPNGAGKTTSFYMMIGLVSADQGVVQLDSREITHLPVHKRAQLGVAYLPQEASVFRRMTAEENILAVLETRPLSEAEKRDTLQRLIEEFRLNKFIRQKAYTLSGGERRRVEVARAMALAPSFLLLDEPFAGIDPLAVADIQEVIRQLKNRNIGILITDHNARETLTICDYGYLLAEGKILVEGTPTDISHDSVAREKYFGEHFQF